MTYPSAIAAVIGDRPGRPEGIGMSGAQVYVFEDYVLKVRPAEGLDTTDTAVLRWLAGRLPAPEVAAHAVEDGRDWLLMTRIRGKMLCAPEVMSKPSLLLDCLAEGLHRLWDADTAGCPFTFFCRDELDAAERAIREGRYTDADCEPETFGPGGFANPMALLAWLRDNAPEERCVLSHGDYCLPNLFTDGRGLSGMIDLGGCGLSDPWRDLSLGWWSLKYNSDGHFGRVWPGIDPDDLFRAAGVPLDRERLRYYLLLKELF